MIGARNLPPKRGRTVDFAALLQPLFPLATERWAVRMPYETRAFCRNRWPARVEWHSRGEGFDPSHLHSTQFLPPKVIRFSRPPNDTATGSSEFCGLLRRHPEPTMSRGPAFPSCYKHNQSDPAMDTLRLRSGPTASRPGSGCSRPPARSSGRTCPRPRGGCRR
jgi:hypothetical protein